MTKNKLTKVGEYYEKLNDLTGSSLPLENIYISEGLRTHLIKQNHSNCLKHIGDIADIIKNPDYVGVNPNQKSDTIELIKVFDENILVGIKLDVNNNYLYISTMHDVQQSKVDRRLHSGRLKHFVVDKEDL